ncbi:MAG: hypothetical protein LBS35_10810, partial [Synergistaceae bacterium]|nr:hypothetical protein [Synergistaceae bacterium]
MKKILLFIALLAVVGVGAAVAGYYFYLSPKARASYTSEAALPSVPDAEYTAAMKLTDMGSFKSIITGVSSLVSDFQPILDGGTASNIRSLLDSLNALLDTVTEMSVLVTPGQLSPAVYVSLLVDGAAFSRIMAEMPNEFLAVEKWDSGIKGSEGWSIKNANGFALYVLKRDGAENSQVLAAGAEEAVSAMISAADDKSRRFSPERMTSGVN